MTMLNSDGQPRDPGLYSHRVGDRIVTEMLGLVKGMIADGELSENEVIAFRRWVSANPDICSIWPGRDLAQRVIEILDDGVIGDEERADLHELFVAAVGDSNEVAFGANPSTRLPLTTPEPTIMFDGRLFTVTGKFVYGRAVARSG